VPLGFFRGVRSNPLVPTVIGASQGLVQRIACATAFPSESASWGGRREARDRLSVGDHGEKRRVCTGFQLPQNQPTLDYVVGSSPLDSMRYSLDHAKCSAWC
jgi:hypothetical protein